MNVEDIMDTWSSQAGFPLVSVERVDGEIVLSQVNCFFFSLLLIKQQSVF